MNWIFISLAMVTIFTPIGIYRRLKRLAVDVAKGRDQLDRLVKQRDNLNFGLSSLDSEEFTTQISGFSAEVNGQRPFAKQKSTRDASKVPEGEGEKTKVQVGRLYDTFFSNYFLVFLPLHGSRETSGCGERGSSKIPGG